MKKNIFPVAAVLMAISCSDASFEESLDAVSATCQMTFSALSDVAPSSRASINPDKTITWNSGDVISVFDVCAEPSNTQFSLISGEGTKSGVFHSDDAKTSASGYYALYPYCKDAALSGTSISGLTLPFEQKLPSEAAANDPAASFMAAFSADDEIAFKNVCSYIKFTLGEFDGSEVKEVRFVSNGGERIAGTFDLSFSGGLPLVSGAEGSGLVTLKPFQSTFAKGEYYLAVLPQTLSKGFSISFATTGKKYWRTTTKPVELKRGTVLNLGELNSSNLNQSAASGMFGAGTEADPFQVACPGDFITMKDKVSSTAAEDKVYQSAYYRQVRDIAFGTNAGMRAPNVGDDSRPFEGTFDGCGYRIELRTQCYDGFTYYGMFLYCRDAEYKNMNVYLDIHADNRYNASLRYTVSGGIVAVAKSSSTGYNRFQNCTINGSEYQNNVDRLYLGGFVGDLQGTTQFLDCTNNAAIMGVNYDQNHLNELAVGGFAGHVEMHDGDCWIEFDRCRNNGNITASSSSEYGTAGGFIGHENEGISTDDIALEMTNCVNKGNVSIECVVLESHRTYRTYAGGLVGMHDSDGDALDPYVHNCVNTGDIYAKSSSKAYAGGLMGYCYDDDTQFRVCANYATVKAKADDSDDQYYGGLCGYDDDLNIKYCLIKSGYKICYGDDATEYTGCNKFDTITAANMNALRSQAGLDGAYVMLWKGENKTLDLDF